MAYFERDDVDAMLRDSPDSRVISFDGTSTRGVLDVADFATQQQSGGPARSYGKRLVLTVRSGTLPGVERGSTLTVDGVDHEVKHLEQIGDGALTQMRVVPA